uniref:Uncharacterized protein n=1 Tax=Homalodisca liturata TaxID=320908 RepID=A0A1B6JQ47_9HEMI
MKLIVLIAFCVIAFTTFSKVAGFDSAEKEDVSEIQNGTYSSGELKDIDYDLDTTRGPVDPSNPPTAPTPAGPGDSSAPFWRRPASLVYLQFCGLLAGLAAMYFLGVYIGGRS